MRIPGEVIISLEFCSISALHAVTYLHDLLSVRGRLGVSIW